jgi:wyosine [tRNA(Phe)-imidazoG37] synthetase (radical SAM superfamily)
MIREESMSLLELQRDVIYGPVSSRRLGRSLGINLLPPGRKLCTFDCAYCQYGSADAVSANQEHQGFPSVGTVLRKVAEAVRRQRAPLDYLTFSGNGEPTLHPDFPEIVSGLLRLRDEMCPQARLAILSNSSRMHRPEIRQAVERLDDPIMKLDAGDPQTLSLLSRPSAAVTFEKLVEGLAGMPRLIIQTMIIAGEVQNVEGEAHEAWLAAVARLSPEMVQLYSAERPVAESGVRRVPKERLEELARQAQERTGIPVKAY